jgi:hypothetical protein
MQTILITLGVFYWASLINENPQKELLMPYGKTLELGF